MNIRPPAVAGMFYPAETALLGAAVDRMLAAAALAMTDAAELKAVIVPHAGYIYSGPIAAHAYARLAAFGNQIRRVVLLGPAHRVPVRGLALPGVTHCATPLGTIEIDADAVAMLRRLPQVSTNPLAHAEEHSLEVQLPFLQRTLGDFKVVPLVVGHATGESVAQVLDLLWGGPETLIVISSDLSHYYPYAEAQVIDRTTADTILGLKPSLDHEEACGATPINGLLVAAARRRLAPSLLDLRNSGDTAGDRRRVVGYASFGFREVGSDGGH